MRVRSGDLLTLSCEAAGDPPPTITWTHYATGRVSEVVENQSLRLSTRYVTGKVSEEEEEEAYRLTSPGLTTLLAR